MSPVLGSAGSIPLPPEGNERPRRRHATVLLAVVLLTVTLAAAGCGVLNGSAGGPPTSAPTGAAPPATTAGSPPPSLTVNIPGGTPSVPASSAPSAPPASSRPPSQPGTGQLPNVVGALESFVSPSGNIACLIIPGESVRCDINERSYTPTPRPSNCPLAWGPALQVGTGAANFACVGDTVLGLTTTVLRYGTSSVVGDYGCTSQQTGMRCVNLATGHGFELAKEDYRFF